MSVSPDIAQGELQCPDCGGQRRYAPDAGALTCDSCGSVHPIPRDPAIDATDDFAHDPAAPDAPHPPTDLIHGCATCGGEVIFPGQSLAQRCPYCDGPAVVTTGAAEYGTMALIPFEQVEDTGWHNARAWIAGRHAAPADLPQALESGKLVGLYAPFFTFDCKEFVRYTGRYKSGKHHRTKRGNLRLAFDDLLAPASPHITPLIRDGVLHDFDPSKLRPYHPGYIAGFAAERHHMSVADGLTANEADKAVLIKNRIQQATAERLSNIRFETDTTGIRYRRILLPVWIVHYTYKGTPYKVVACGLHGTTFGERPFSTAKLFGYAATLSAMAIGVGIAWGALGLP
ncbi:MAG: hypothetical protein AAF092_11955 [Pseudomonadota bacterium]